MTELGFEFSICMTAKIVFYFAMRHRGVAGISVGRRSNRGQPHSARDDKISWTCGTHKIAHPAEDAYPPHQFKAISIT